MAEMTSTGIGLGDAMILGRQGWNNDNYGYMWNNPFFYLIFMGLFGCGSAAIAGQVLGNLGIALAFGLSIVAMAYVIGDISGCHINPAVSIGMFIDGRLSAKDLICYIIFQCIGAIIGSALLLLIIMNALCSDSSW